MHASRFAKTLLVVAAGHCLVAAPSWAARPAAEEIALRDRWVKEHFPSQPAGGAGKAASSGPSSTAAVNFWP